MHCIVHVHVVDIATDIHVQEGKHGKPPNKDSPSESKVLYSTCKRAHYASSVI